MSNIAGVAPLIFAGCCALMAVMMVLLIGLSAYQTRKQKIAARTWYSVQANIIKSFVETRTTWQKPPGNPNGPSRPVYHYYPVVIYQYVVNGQLHESRRISFGGDVSSVTTQGAKYVVDRYPVGSVQTAYYDPDRPDQSVLDRGM